MYHEGIRFSCKHGLWLVACINKTKDCNIPVTVPVFILQS